MAGALAAAHVAALRMVTRRSLDNGMVKFEIVVASAEAAIVWAALNAATAKAGIQPTPADSSLAEPSPAETTRANQTRADQTPAEPRSAEPSLAEPSLATPPIAKAPTSTDRGRQRADASIAGSYSGLGRRYSDDGHGALPATRQGRGHRSDASRQGPCRAIFSAIEATTPRNIKHRFNFESGSMCDVEEATTGR